MKCPIKLQVTESLNRERASVYLYLDFLRRLEESGVDEKRRQRLLHVAVRAMMEAGL